MTRGPRRHPGPAARPQGPPGAVLRADAARRARLLAILADPILPGTDPSQGRPGMDLWRILVMGVIKPGRDGDDDRRGELAGAPRTLRAFLGHGDDARSEDRTGVDTIAASDGDPGHPGRPGRRVPGGWWRPAPRSADPVAGHTPGAPLVGRARSCVAPASRHRH